MERLAQGQEDHRRSPKPARARRAAAEPSAAQGELKQLSLADQGKQVYETKSCNTCHSNDGTTKIGPTWKGLTARKVELVDGKNGHRGRKLPA